jgi:hypothetical protein
MNIVKWMRKNNTKIMAIVVVALMFVFIGGEYIQQFGRRRTQRQTVGYFLDNRKITNYDIAVAQRELEVLKILRADDLLRAQDLGGIFLSELLFSQRRASPELLNHLRQLIRKSEYRVSDKQIGDIYSHSMSNNIYWLLLRNEAQQAGIRIPNEDAGNILAQTIPKLFNGQSYSQFIGILVRGHGIAEEQVLEAFSKLLAVLQYAQVLCSNENVTTAQITHIASWENETIDAEFVKFDSAVFAAPALASQEAVGENQPAEEKMAEHFNKFKQLLPGTTQEQNPYGFGYKSPDRAQLEYIALKLDDVAATVAPPTQEETEEYYQRNRDQLFTEEVRSDPNDPNSPLVKLTKSYAQVANTIFRQLLQDKINSKAERILQEARTITEVNWSAKEVVADSSVEDRKGAEQLKQMAGDYKAAARQLTEKHKIKIYTGQTGLLTAADMQTDKNIATLYIQQGAGYNPVRLIQMVFAVDELGGSLGPLDAPRPRLYENIGPSIDLLSQMLKPTAGSSGQIMTLVRVIQAVKASEPQGIDQTFSIKTLDLAPEPNAADPKEQAKIYSVKEKVIEDLNKLAAMDTTKSKAEEFIGLATKDGWDSTLGKFNELYRQPAKQDQSEPNAFTLENLTSLRRLSGAVLQTLAVQGSGSPVADIIVNERKKQAEFVAQLYSLVPPDSNTPAKLPAIMEFKPDMSFYCLKNLTVNHLYQEDFEKIKARRLFREDYAQAQSLVAVHFNPENILKRMNFRRVSEDENEDREKPADSNAP